MSRLLFDLDVLRTFVTGVEAGAFAKAAERLGRSTSAVSAQLKKLEDQIGQPILQKSGRGLVLTPRGEQLFSYAQRLLALNDEAALALRAEAVEGRVRIGVQEDFGERFLPAVLGRFMRAYPQVRVEARVQRNAQLGSAVENDQLDLALLWDTGHPLPNTEVLERFPLLWIGNESMNPLTDGGEPVPLALFEEPCLMRRAALEALNQAGKPWRIAFSSISLTGIWAAVAAGLGVTVRTTAGMPGGLQPLKTPWPLPEIQLLLYASTEPPTKAVQYLSRVVRQTLHETSQPFTERHDHLASALPMREQNDST